jgi:hypothetical protein
MPRAASTKKPVIESPSLTEAKARSKRVAPNIIQTLNSPKLFKPFFSASSWDNWKTVLKAGDGLPMTDAETEFFRSIAGGREPPTGRMRERWWVVGRRGGKDSIASLLAAHTAALFDSPHLLRGGERALVLCLAGTRRQAQIILNYIRDYFVTVPPDILLLPFRNDGDMPSLTGQQLLRRHLFRRNLVAEIADPEIPREPSADRLFGMAVLWFDFHQSSLGLPAP